MINYREILRLQSLGYSQRSIASRAKTSHNTVSEVLKKAEQLNITWLIDNDVTNEVLDEMFCGEHKSNSVAKVIKAYKKVDLLILDEWLIHSLTPNDAYNMLEIIEAHIEHSVIFCTQYHSKGWYDRINPDPENDSPHFRCHNRQDSQ